MCARLLASICLISCSVPVALLAEPPEAQTLPLGVYVKTDLELSRLPLSITRQEVDSMLAPAGIELGWMDAKHHVGSMNFSRVIAVDLRGNCDATAEVAGEFLNHSALASTAVVDGKVLPFVWVDCSALHRLLRSSLASASGTERVSAYGRALARVLGHELYHAIAETQDHTRKGIAKEKFTPSDLLAKNLEFEPQALARLRPSAIQPVSFARNNAKPDPAAKPAQPGPATNSAAVVGIAPTPEPPPATDTWSAEYDSAGFSIHEPDQVLGR